MGIPILDRLTFLDYVKFYSILFARDGGKISFNVFGVCIPIMQNFMSTSDTPSKRENLS